MHAILQQAIAAGNSSRWMKEVDAAGKRSRSCLQRRKERQAMHAMLQQENAAGKSNRWVLEVGAAGKGSNIAACSRCCMQQSRLIR